MTTIDIIPGPGVVQNDFSLIKKRVEAVSSYVDWVQIDIADNNLVPNKTSLDASAYQKALSNIDVHRELHMMIEDPIAVSQEWIDAGFNRLLFHIEGIKDVSNLKNNLITIKNQNIEVGLAIDNKTPVDTVYPYLDHIDCVLVMTIAAGFSGQSFIPELLDKVKVLRQKKPDMPIEVDGGITYDTAKLAIDAGAARLAATSAIFNAPNLKEAIEKLQQL